jgi:hypothetical protein
MTNSVSLGTNPDVFKVSVGLQLSYLSLSSIFSGRLNELDNKVSFLRHRLQLSPRSAPSIGKNVRKMHKLVHLAFCHVTSRWNTFYVCD